MTPGVRVIRFARVDPVARSSPGGTVLVGRVLLDEQLESSGEVVLRDQVWSYLLPGGLPSGLSSTASRQDLERQITLYHLGALPSALPGEPGSPLKIAM